MIAAPRKPYAKETPIREGYDIRLALHDDRLKSAVSNKNDSAKSQFERTSRWPTEIV